MLALPSSSHGLLPPQTPSLHASLMVDELPSLPANPIIKQKWGYTSSFSIHGFEAPFAPSTSRVQGY